MIIESTSACRRAGDGALWFVDVARRASCISMALHQWALLYHAHVRTVLDSRDRIQEKLRALARGLFLWADAKLIAVKSAAAAQ